MQVKQVMTKHIDSLPPNASLQAASTSMQKHNVGFLPVEKNGILVGVLTDRDITIHGVAKQLDPSTPIEQVMTKNVVIVHEEDDVSTAARIMEQKHIRRLIVLNEDEEISGIISLDDIATKCKDIDISAAIIRALSEKSR